MSNPLRRGPYMNDDVSEVYLPAEEWTLNEARREAASVAQMEMGSLGRSRYLGKRNAKLHDHDDWWGCQKCPDEPAWTFETYEGTYRRGGPHD